MTAVRAVLFDFNGVLVDDETFHWRAFRETIAPLGVRLGRARYNARYLVFDDRTALAAILRDARIDAADIEGLVARKRRVYARLARRVRIGPGTARLVRALARRGPLAIVSGAARREVTAALRRVRLLRLFGTVVTAEDVRRPKPWPDGYRLALRRLGLAGGRGSVAIEDSPGGVRAARAAGLVVIGVATTFRPAVLRRAGAAHVAAGTGALRIAQVLGPDRGAGSVSRASGRRPSRRRS